MNHGPVEPSRYLADAELESTEDFAETLWWEEAFDKIEVRDG